MLGWLRRLLRRIWPWSARTIKVLPVRTGDPDQPYRTNAIPPDHQEPVTPEATIPAQTETDANPVLAVQFKSVRLPEIRLPKISFPESYITTNYQVKEVIDSKVDYIEQRAKDLGLQSQEVSERLKESTARLTELTNRLSDYLSGKKAADLAEMQRTIDQMSRVLRTKPYSE